MASADATQAASGIPLLARWQGLMAPNPAVLRRLEGLAGLLLLLLFTGLPLFTRTGLALVIAACGALWLVWCLCSPPRRIGAVSLWLMLFLAIAALATGFSPVPIAASKGLIKLLSYLGVYALLCKLLLSNERWWDRLVAGLLSGGLLSSVLALRQLYASSEELAGWADPNSISAGTIRIYGPLGNPNLLAGYLLPLIPFAAIALVRWLRRGSAAAGNPPGDWDFPGGHRSESCQR